MTTRIEVLAPFKVALAGQVWRPGETAEVDDAIAERWVRYRYVTVVEVLPEPEPELQEPEQQPVEEEPERHRKRAKQPDTEQPEG